MRLFVLLFSTLFIGALSAQHVQNGDFENWSTSSDFPAYWSAPSYPTGSAFLVKSEDAHSGNNSLQMIFTPEKKGENRRFFSSAMEMKQGSYTVSLFLKGKGVLRFITLTKEKAKPSSNPSEVNIMGLPKIGSVKNKDWKQHDMKFEIPSDGMYNLHICFNSGSAEAPLLLDDITIKRD